METLMNLDESVVLCCAICATPMEIASTMRQPKISPVFAATAGQDRSVK